MTDKEKKIVQVMLDVYAESEISHISKLMWGSDRRRAKEKLKTVLTSCTDALGMEISNKHKDYLEHNRCGK